ncbi:MAG: secondary thiamine-phosphate synthase enzyme YjbQ [Pseudomonadota bacterium]
MFWAQTNIQLAPRSEGFHLITEEVTQGVDDLARCRIGLLHLFLKHSSASLAINENADPDVRGDLQRHLDVLVPRNQPHYRHTLEGPDDMPAHIKSVLIGESLTIPVSDGRLALGTWQGIYLCEHRDHGGARTMVATLQGEKAN